MDKLIDLNTYPVSENLKALLKVSFARRSICLCMRILIWKEQGYC